MVAAISAVIAAASTPSPDSSTAWSKGCFFKMPNLRDEVKRQISTAAAWAAWHGIFDALNDQQIRGKTTEIRINAERGVVGVGLHAIARAVGVSVSTIRRQVGRLEGLGLVVVHRPQLLHVADPTTGKITTKQNGRTPPAVVYVTVLDEHLRPFRKGAKCNPSAPTLRVHNAPPSKDTKKYQRPPSRRTYGAGGGTAGEAGRQEPAKAGGHSAAKAVQERGTSVDLRPYRPGLTVNEAPRQPQVWEGSDADRLRATQARLAAEKARRDREDAEAAGRPQPAQQAPTTPAEHEAELRQAVAALPPAKKQRCRRLGRKAKAEADEMAAAEKLIADAVADYHAKQAAANDAEAAGRREASAAKAETYRQAYRREKAALAGG